MLSSLMLSATGRFIRAKEGACRKVSLMSPVLGGSLWSWEVCSLPLSHREVRHTMSNFPILVTSFRFLLFCSGLGLRQNKYCQLSPDWRHRPRDTKPCPELSSALRLDTVKVAEGSSVTRSMVMVD